jgi:hypothetical protein
MTPWTPVSVNTPICNAANLAPACDSVASTINSALVVELNNNAGTAQKALFFGQPAQDENAFFEVWFALDRFKRWQSLYGNEDMPQGWSEGFKEYMRIAWMARASLHVTKEQSV